MQKSQNETDGNVIIAIAEGLPNFAYYPFEVVRNSINPSETNDLGALFMIPMSFAFGLIMLGILFLLKNKVSNPNVWKGFLGVWIMMIIIGAYQFKKANEAREKRRSKYKQ